MRPRLTASISFEGDNKGGQRPSAAAKMSRSASRRGPRSACGSLATTRLTGWVAGGLEDLAGQLHEIQFSLEPRHRDCSNGILVP